MTSAEKYSVEIEKAKQFLILVFPETRIALPCQEVLYGVSEFYAQYNGRPSTDVTADWSWWWAYFNRSGADSQLLVGIAIRFILEMAISESTASNPSNSEDTRVLFEYVLAYGCPLIYDIEYLSKEQMEISASTILLCEKLHSGEAPFDTDTWESWVACAKDIINWPTDM